MLSHTRTLTTCSRMFRSYFALLLLLATAVQGDESPAHSSALDFLTELDYLIHLAASTCSQAGQIICSVSCDQVILCIADGEGGFTEVPVETCSADSRCSAEQGGCVAGSTACGAPSNGSAIQCHDTGYFPDPYNCTLYHLCLMENTYSLVYQCDPGYAYNPRTDDCSFQLTDPVCTDGPVPACVEVGQAGALDTNPSIYYICTSTSDSVLIPQLYKCPHGEVYDPTIYTCVDSTP